MYSKIIELKNFWTKKTTPDFVRGFFDEEHYKKVIEQKIKLIEYENTNNISRINR